MRAGHFLLYVSAIQAEGKCSSASESKVILVGWQLWSLVHIKEYFVLNYLISWLMTPGCHSICLYGQMNNLCFNFHGSHKKIYVPVHNTLLYYSGSHVTCVDIFVAGGVLVDSAHCLQEEVYDRPMAAYVNFCPRVLSTDPAHFDTQLYLVLKELIHSLV